MEQRLGLSNAIREAFELAEHLKAEYGQDQVFDLSIGNPTAPCPAGVRQALLETANYSAPGVHGYMQECGYAPVRSTVAWSLNRRFGTSFSADHIVMTTGAACALNLLMRSVLDPGDEVIVFLPFYPAYAPFAETFGAQLVPVPYNPETMLPDLDAFAQALSTRTKMVIVNSPNNPTGLVYPESIAAGIAQVLNNWHAQTGNIVLLVSDEPYRELVYDGAQSPWWPEYYDHTAVVYSFSKVASVAGERIGYVALAPTLGDVSTLRRALCRCLGELGFVSAPATAQRIAAFCADDMVDVSYYDNNRRALYGTLCDLGFAPTAGNGAFYLLLPAPDGDEARLINLLAAERIVVVGGSAFGAPGTVRLSYCATPATITAALPHFKAVARAYFEGKK